jgi:peptide-methionine (S)-S-oxide reductase
MTFARRKTEMPTESEALPGRERPMPVTGRHLVTGASLTPPFPEGMATAMFAMGCFWGAERRFWETPGVHSTAAGYAGGFTPNPTYEEVCTGATGHAETVLVVFDPAKVSYEDLLRVFWESHDPTQGMRQGGDVGTQYRSVVFAADEAQRQAAEASRDAYLARLRESGYGPITTEIRGPAPFYYAEDYHQQYLISHPEGYCGLGGTGVSCPTGLVVEGG